jgi:transcriptional regulator with XRE-family HTH domain
MSELKGVPGVAGPFDPLDFSAEPVPGWRHPITGRRGWEPSPGLVLFGRYLRRARYFNDKSQDLVSRESGVSQSMISRAERALAPAMGIDRLVLIGESLGANLPLGFCPHKHVCAWQPLPSPARPADPFAAARGNFSPALLKASRDFERSNRS